VETDLAARVGGSEAGSGRGRPAPYRASQSDWAFAYRLLLGLTGNHHDACDLTQETLLKASRVIGPSRPVALSSWLARIATNSFKDELRRRARHPAALLADGPDSTPDPGLGPEECCSLSELSDSLAASVAALPEEFRQPVILCDVQGLGYRDIAERLHLPLGTVRSRIHRGRLLLRAALAGDQPSAIGVGPASARSAEQTEAP
jgi:RNA polymerase sigma factor (sigma-70 family)